jgi:uncharacterized protein (TIGR02145 family)
VAYGTGTINPPVPFVCGNPLVDTRDGKNYPTVLIGTQCWMVTNLNIGARVIGSQEQADNGIIEKYCYDDNDSNCDIYGGLYQWDEAMKYMTTPGIQGICPVDWHLPSNDEWTALKTILGGYNIAGGKMKETGFAHWLPPNTGATNTSGFTALPGGFRHVNVNFLFLYLTQYAIFWSSSVLAPSDAWSWSLGWDFESIGGQNDPRNTGLSIRCIKN